MNKMRKVIHAALNMASIGSKNEDFPSGTSEVPGMGNKRIEMIVEKETAEVMKSFDLTQDQMNVTATEDWEVLEPRGTMIGEIQECFKLFTVHGGGSINAVELQKVCKSVGKEFSEEDIREILLEVDEKQTGEIDFIDFVKMMGKEMKEPLHESDIQTVFDVFDQDGDTFISPEEMHRTFLSLGVDLTAQELNGIFEQYDHDYDGLICFDDLKPLIEEIYNEICPQIFHDVLNAEEEEEETNNDNTSGAGFG